jgi:hypothetical protein
MGKTNAPLLALNRGEVSKKSLARVDMERMRLSAETQINFMPWVLGPMMLRPGLQYRGGIYNDATCRLLPFVFSNSDLALIELTDSIMRVWDIVADVETLVTRPAVSTTVTNGDFSAGAGWTLDGSGGAATIASGTLKLSLTTAGGMAQAKQTVSVAGGDQGVLHAFRIVVDSGPVRFRAGTTDGDDNLITETYLDTGTHSLAFTPTTGSVFIQIDTLTAQDKIVDSIEIESSGAMTLPTTWTADDLMLIRYDQSGDIIFTACQGQAQRKIERRGINSWSFVLYKSDDGPFQSANFTDITLTPSDLISNGTLTASRKLFRPEHIGCLFRLFSTGQTSFASVAASDTYTSTIRVVGVGDARRFSYSVTGVWVGTITLQRSLDSETSGFVDVLSTTANVDTSYDDGLDNSIAWYRIGFKAAAYVSGTASLTLAYAFGGGPGICRVTDYVSNTVVYIENLTPFSSTSATGDWNEGDWSDVVGWPSSVAFFDGRLWWAGRDKIWGSVSDAYNSFDIDFLGDAGPINRTVGFGPVDTINWLLPLSRLIVGRQGAETSVRSSALDTPLTPTNFGLKDCSTQGSAPIGAIKVDTRGIFVQQSNRRVYELNFTVQLGDYNAVDLTRLNQDIGLPGLVDLAVQRQPDTQLHFVRTDGVVAALLHDIDDEVTAWWRIETDGEIESVCVLPGAIENRVYYSVKRTIDGNTKRFLERLARRDQCDGQPESRCADSHVIYSGAATTTITGLDHLVGQEVVAWGFNTDTPFTATLPDGTVKTVGKDFGTFRVSGGAITLPEAVTDACVGLGYSGTFKSSKLAYAAQNGTALTQTKKVDKVGLILADTHFQGLEYGSNFTTMDNLPLIEDGDTLDTSTVWEAFDGMTITVPGEWNTDARLCLRATAPRPCMVMAAIVEVTTNED